MPAILFYDVVLSIHIMAVVIAFGVTFVYPVIVPFLIRQHPQVMPAWHVAQDRIGRFLITPGATVALIAGIYLASDRHYWSEVWVIVPLIILAVLMGLGGAYFSPQERRSAELASRDLDAAAAGGAIQWSAEYVAISRRIARVGMLASTLVLVAIFFMAAKPFA